MRLGNFQIRSCCFFRRFSIFFSLLFILSVLCMTTMNALYIVIGNNTRNVLSAFHVRISQFSISVSGSRWKYLTCGNVC